MPRVVALSAAVLATAVLLAGCSGDDPSASSSSPADAETTDDLGARTPGDLRPACRVVPGKVASEVLGVKVTASRVANPRTHQTLDCRYVAAAGTGGDGLSLAISSTFDPRGLPSVVGLYLGADRLLHHPVDVPGADDAEVILAPRDATPSVTVFAKQGFVTHTVVLARRDVHAAEKQAVELATLVVAGNH